MKKPANEQIFEETGIMLHPEPGDEYMVTTGSRQLLGNIKKYFGKYMFVPSGNISAYGQDDMINIGYTLELLNGDRKIVEE